MDRLIDSHDAILLTVLLRAPEPGGRQGIAGRATGALTFPRIEQPALMITAERDVVLRPEMAEGMTTWVPNLRKTVLVRGSGHWTQQEKPAEVNAAILDFLSDMKK